MRLTMVLHTPHDMIIGSLVDLCKRSFSLCLPQSSITLSVAVSTSIVSVDVTATISSTDAEAKSDSEEL